MRINYGDDVSIKINSKPFKGNFTDVNGKNIKAYFFSAKLNIESPNLSTFIIYNDENNLAHIEIAPEDINQAFSKIESIEKLTDDELVTDYCQILLNFIEQNNIEIPDPIPGKPLYIEDQIIQAIKKEHVRK